MIDVFNHFMPKSIFERLSSLVPGHVTLTAPTLLLYADSFGLVQDDQVEAFRHALGDRLEIVTVPGGHMVYWDAWDETAGAVERFLAGS